MTLEEIQALTLDDVRTEVTDRVLTKYATHLDGNPNLLDELLNLEMEVYRSELLEDENKRLEAERIQQELILATRKEAAIEKLEGLGDITEAYYSIHTQPNMKLWLKENIYGNSDVSDIEAKVDALESKKTELENSPEKAKREWEQNLRIDLSQNKISTDGLVEALVRKVILDDSTLADALKVKLQEIDQRNPRP